MVCHERCAIARTHFFGEHMPQGRTPCECRRICQRRRIIQLASQLQTLQCDRACREQVVIRQHNRAGRGQLG